MLAGPPHNAHGAHAHGQHAPRIDDLATARTSLQRKLAAAERAVSRALADTSSLGHAVPVLHASTHGAGHEVLQAVTGLDAAQSAAGSGTDANSRMLLQELGEDGESPTTPSSPAYPPLAPSQPPGEPSIPDEPSQPPPLPSVPPSEAAPPQRRVIGLELSFVHWPGPSACPSKTILSKFGQSALFTLQRYPWLRDAWGRVRINTCIKFA